MKSKLSDHISAAWNANSPVSTTILVCKWWFMGTTISIISLLRQTGFWTDFIHDFVQLVTHDQHHPDVAYICHSDLDSLHSRKLPDHIRRIVSVVNHNNVHYAVIQVNINKKAVEVYDSYFYGRQKKIMMSQNGV